MEIEVRPFELAWGATRVRCALGRAGVGRDKAEGDGKTPAGCFALRRVLYRADRLDRPATGLRVRALRPTDGWCDDPRDAAYNRLVSLPYPARHEKLWRADGLYDVIVVLGYNDDPPAPSLGSAIFLHVAAPDFAPTEGCVAIGREGLLRLLARCDRSSRLCVRPDAR